MKLEDKSWYKFLPPETEMVNKENLRLFFYTMFERQEIWYKRFILKEKQPWTKDPFFSAHKFTNVYRELDRASQYLVHNILMDHTLTKKDYLFRSIIYRFYNEPNTFNKENSIQAITLPHYDTYDVKDLWEQTVNYRENVGNPWHTAYLMNPAEKKPADWKKRGLFKDDVYCNTVFPAVHALIPGLVKVIDMGANPAAICKVLETLPAVAGFMSHEFYIDMCYAARYWRGSLFEWTQNDYTNVGPGASTGIRLIFPILKGDKQQIQAMYWLQELAEGELKRYDEYGGFKYLEWNREEKHYEITNKFNLTLHQFEMWLCEYQKYWKMKIGAGKQRSVFAPKTKRLSF